ncbi:MULTISPECIES: DJ-1/PfpI family protein [unclassified Fusibacter]|uniref:DJ-1/PfpI family protein n=1 Tax=unclassified Fusibacter TaxID=2624464 RepID=UPI00101168F7|nr:MULTISPECIES: DJ-1/PfpI family protein [unclassified Fusibacter]MCK8058461.1 DJ-1/PfpI family protein [Fusibacter sp. A2]NPE22771.1 type 1 glutamine amidotransferase domain-containing protein [Fusibacter sp. A1]RXV60328.1 type 1 glutamine amidotransferase domain-containing protein [Fusibacter sp. A1]
MGKKVLVLASNYGLWAEELQAPWDIMKSAGFDLTLATYKGMTPLPGSMSMDPDFIDPQQGVAMNPQKVIDRVNEILDTGEWDNSIKFSDADMDQYDALVMVGGAGSPLDIAGNLTVHELIYKAYKSGKIIGALCYTVGALAFTRDPENDYRSVIYGKKVTAHPHEWDFVGDHNFEFHRPTPTNPDMKLMINGFLFPLQFMVEDAVGDRKLVSADPTTSRENPCVIYDHPFVTGLSVESSSAYGHKLVEVINKM